MGINNQLANQFEKLNLKPQNLTPSPSSQKPRHVKCNRYLPDCKCAEKAKEQR